MKKVLVMFLVITSMSVFAQEAGKTGEVAAVDQVEAQVCSAEIDGALQDSSLTQGATKGSAGDATLAK